MIDPVIDPVIDWALPTFPHEPLDDTLEVLELDEAYLTAVRMGDLRTLETPNRWITGAVHESDGRLVVASQKIGGLHGHQGAPADPKRVRPRPDAQRLTGTWLYAGHWIQHFGHFILESLTTLWPTGLQVEGLVFHRHFGQRPQQTEWQHELLGHAGYGGLPVEIVDRAPVRVERLLVPSRSVIVNGWALEGARDVWQRIVDAVGTGEAGPEKVFVSRHDFNERERAAGRPTRTPERRDERLDRIFADAGFDVVAPETLAVRDQIRLAAGAQVLAGSAGTALHLSAFSPAGTRVIELGDRRSPSSKVPLQRVVDAVCGHPSVFVPFDVPAQQVRDVLRELGVC